MRSGCSEHTETERAAAGVADTDDVFAKDEDGLKDLRTIEDEVP